MNAPLPIPAAKDPSILATLHTLFIVKAELRALRRLMTNDPTEQQGQPEEEVVPAGG